MTGLAAARPYFHPRNRPPETKWGPRRLTHGPPAAGCRAPASRPAEWDRRTTNSRPGVADGRPLPFLGGIFTSRRKITPARAQKHAEKPNHRRETAGRVWTGSCRLSGSPAEAGGRTTRVRQPTGPGTEAGGSRRGQAPKRYTPAGAGHGSGTRRLGGERRSGTGRRGRWGSTGPAGGPAGRGQSSVASSQRSVSIAAIHPVPAAVTAWR